MARKEKKDNSKLREMIAEYGIKDMNDVHEFVKMLTAETIQAELENELGYSKYDYKNKQTSNSRNGPTRKKVQGNMGELEIAVLRDRDGEFAPQLVKKHQTDISAIEDKVIFLYSQGTSTRDIQKTMQEMYGINDSRVPKITDKILPLVKEWQERPLQSVYAMVILDAVHYSVRENGVVTKKAAYVAVGTDLDGHKDVLGIWLGATESAKYWLTVLNGLKNRGVQDMLIVSVDGLSGFVDAIGAAFPQTEAQRCIIHQISSSTRYVSYKDLKVFTAALKPIYKAPTKEVALAALAALDELEDTWGEKYPLGVKSWRVNWNELSIVFKYPPEIRKLIYTTNAIENFNRQLRKVTKTKSAFVSDDALMKILYLATMSIVAKWTMPVQGWPNILAHLSIYFGDRVHIQL